jgi:crotonobetainyl-CoA:carnitine CoA-transferase CaiB-like acyl-CoA transferase
MNTVLNNLKVIELAGVLAGPAVGTFLAELGAEVIKIESPAGDVTRSWKLEKENKETPVSAYFSSVNYGKKYLRLDLRNEDDKNKLYEFIRESDILITNYKKGDDLKLGTDYQTLKKINPHIIYASINGYGDDSERTAFDAVLQAETGFMSMNGTPESGPIKMPVALIDVLAAHQLKEGILAAVIHKMKTGKGSKVSVSLFDAALASLMNQASNWLMCRDIPKLQGSLHPNIAPYGETFKTSDDKYILIAVGSDVHFASLCKITGNETLPHNENFSSNHSRVKNRAELYPLLSEKLNTNTAGYWNTKMNEMKIPNGIIKNLKEVFEDEKAKSLVISENINGTETLRVKNTVFKISFE